MFRGFRDGRPIIIAKYFIEFGTNEAKTRSRAIRDIVISIQLSNHENVLKLLGCCLEFRTPALVHEYAAKGVLYYDGSLRVVAANQNQILPWKIRLCIAKKLASVVTHLHNAFPRPIIHRDLKANCIFVDNDYVPKLSNFSLSITIPPAQSDVVRGHYFETGYFVRDPNSEKGDVFSFGVLLLVLLTGQSASNVTKYPTEYRSVVEYVKSEQFQTFVDPKIIEEVGVNEQVEQQLRDFLALALVCTEDENERRPYMMHVADELARIDDSILPG